MKPRKFLVLSIAAASLTLLGSFWSSVFPGIQTGAAEARRHHLHTSTRKSTRATSQRGRSTKQKRRTATGRSKKVSASKPKYAYPLDFFMMHPPAFDRTPLEEGLAAKVKDAFSRGIAHDIPAEKLVRAGVFHYYPLSGGIFKRREPVKYIVLHSTETGPPVPAKNVINGWNSMGRRHPGAQFVVDRDGTIYQALDPDLASVHVNIFKTLPGINNDNTIGIEMNHTGRQNYPEAQRHAVMRLVTYLQHRYKVTSDNVITHRYAQQGDHTDPVNFDLEGFLASKEDFRNKAIALKRTMSPPPIIDEETEDDAPLASVYVQIHGLLAEPNSSAQDLNSQKKIQTETMAPLPGTAGGGTVAAGPIAMPKGTFVAGGALSPDSSPATEAQSQK